MTKAGRHNWLPEWKGAEAHSLSVSEAGEAAVTQSIQAAVEKAAAEHPGSVTASHPHDIGIGDDAAVLTVSSGRIVVSVDMLVEDRHFRRAWSTPAEVGRRAVAQNMADIAAMGAKPISLFIGLGLPADTEVSIIDGLYAGIISELQSCGAVISGGDLVIAPSLTLAVTAIGEAKAASLTLSGAQPGDAVIIAGQPGWSAAGYELLSKDIDLHTLDKDVLDVAELAISRFRVPEVDYLAGVRAADNNAHCLTDTSDGLLRDLGAIAQASQVHCVLDSKQLYSDQGLRRLALALGHESAQNWTLGVGEDHALVGTCEATRIPPGFRRIGTVTEGPASISVDGELVTAEGWDTFQGVPQ